MIPYKSHPIKNNQMGKLRLLLTSQTHFLISLILIIKLLKKNRRITNNKISTFKTYNNMKRISKLKLKMKTMKKKMI